MKFVGCTYFSTKRCHSDYLRQKSHTNRTQRISKESQKMKDEYDFSNAEQGKFYTPIEEIQLPIYLDKDILESLIKQCGDTQGLQVLVNDLLRKDIEIARRVTMI